MKDSKSILGEKILQLSNRTENGLGRGEKDKLQRNYQQISDMFGITKNQALAAIDALRDIGVISKEFRNLVVNGVRINNVMYINLNPERLIELTYPEEIQCLSVSNLNRTGYPF